MGLSAAERQRAYRARRNEGEGDRRLNTWVTMGAYLALRRLARHSGGSQREVLQRLISDADDAILRDLDPDSAAWADYFGGQAR